MCRHTSESSSRGSRGSRDNPRQLVVHWRISRSAAVNKRQQPPLPGPVIRHAGAVRLRSARRRGVRVRAGGGGTAGVAVVDRAYSAELFWRPHESVLRWNPID